MFGGQFHRARSRCPAFRGRQCDVRITQIAIQESSGRRQPPASKEMSAHDRGRKEAAFTQPGDDEARTTSIAHAVNLLWRSI